MGKKMYRDNVIIKNRLFFVLLIFILIFSLLICRLFKVNVILSPKYKKMAIDQWTSEVKISAKRGRILDRNGQELAVSGNVYRIDLDLSTIRTDLNSTKKMDMNTLAQKLAEDTGMKPEDVSKLLNYKLPNGSPAGSATLIRRVEKSVADKVSQLKVNGIIVSPDTKRYYVNNNFLAQVLGHTNSDGKGLTGVELEYDNYLSGTPGKRIAEIGRNSSNLPYTISDYTKPVNGKDVVLTIDENIQEFAEKNAEQALSDNKAKAVSIVVANPKNGEILAMVNKPDYNPNDPWQKGKSFNELQSEWRNRAVNDAYEPGSIFKVITATAAMEEKVVKATDQFNCTGSITIAKKIIHCWKRTGHGQESFVDIIKNSCNVGFAALGQRLGAANLNKWINDFGFGQKTGIDLPGEAKGIIKPTNKISPVDVATIAFGQANTVSMVQYLSAFDAVANNGVWVKPHVMKKIVHYDSNNKEIVDKNYDDYGTKKIMDENVAKELRGYLEQVISDGGGKKAFIDGYHIAGKTGTAQKPNPNGGGYESGKYVASFAGMAPANDPQVTVMISIDEPDPSNYYAGQIATPVAKQMFSDIFNYLNIKADAPSGDVEKSMLNDVVVPNVRGMKLADAQKLLKDNNLAFDADQNGGYVTNITPLPGATVKEGTKVILYTGGSANYNSNDVEVPDLDGLSKQKASQMLEALGLKANFDGDGMVSDQDIVEGTKVQRGTTVNLDLENIGD
ncbi:stage V sporulation protein D [Clostridium pasteurianum]|uniref:Stage V sporulation protein D n=1 Tax=Clostridium pasteurianum BC1 TaxID=86416 RepID=R4KDN7_CLOPA|nr:stage V sporulation protein D [Clostridium pasteurianum BC1]